MITAADDADLREELARWWIQIHREELTRHHTRVAHLLVCYETATADEILFDVSLLTQLARARRGEVLVPCTTR